MNSCKGKLIVIEGIDGTGKSTQASMLADALRAQGNEVVQSFEPTNGLW
ncbi:MAG: dTMP kinase, partial [Verrucomicrobiae bacterium]|nr:dTMP kinase [Verrucomicrobiae bacterium]NNJ87607.1 dTMP kinase [Akkermansiaceae bacterium]